MLWANFLTFFNISMMVYFWKKDLRKNTYIFSPIKLFIFVTSVYLVLPSLILPNFYIESLFWNLQKELIFKTNLMILIFNLTFLVAFNFLQKIEKSKFGFSISKRAVILSLVFLIIAMFSKYYMYQKGLFFLEDDSNIDAEIPRVIRLFNNLHLWGYMIITIYFFKDKRNSTPKKEVLIKIFFLFYFLFSVGIPLLQGRRFGVIFPVIIFISMYLFHNRIKFLKLVKYFLFILILFTIMTVFRQAQVLAIGYNLEIDLENIIGAVGFIEANYLVESALSRIFNVYINLNRVIEFKDSIDYTSFYNPFFLAFAGLVPSFIWGSKPSLSIGNQLGKELGLIHESNDIIGINIGWIGEGYFYSSELGVFLASLFFCITIVIMTKLFSKFSDAGKIVILMYVVFMVSGFQMELAFSFNSFFKGTFMLLLLLGILSNKIYRIKKYR